MLKFEYTPKTLIVCAAVLIASTLIAFWPGTSGSFLVDDYHNLQPLGKSGGIEDFDSLRQYVFDGESGPTGRPLSLLSFVIDSRTWPAEAFSFKVTNIILHALNAILILAVVLKLFQSDNRNNNRAFFIASLTALVWALHPLHTSTVLYVIQRMVELMTLFMLIGIWCYLHGRQRLAYAPGPGYLWMSSGVILFGALAVLSKENGILLPLLILVLELTVLRSVPKPDHWRYWALPMIGIPVLFIFSYLGYVAFNHTNAFITRDFTLYERLLSESRIIFSYLGKIIFPISTPTLNHDDHVISTSLVSPLSTLPAILGIVTLVGGAIAFRKRYPIIAFAVLWFFAAHVLESTTLPLELYFEHRNYLAMLGPILALAYYIEKLKSKNLKAVAVGIGALFIVEIGMTLNHSYTWGEPTRLSHAWAEEHPDSIRASGVNAIQAYSIGNNTKALQIAQRLIDKFPDQLGVNMLYVLAACNEEKLPPSFAKELIQKANELKPDSLATNMVRHIGRSIAKGQCNQLNNNTLIAIINGLLNNPHSGLLSKKQLANLYVVLSDIYLGEKDAINALYAIDETFALYPSMELALKQAYILGLINQSKSAMTQINKAIALDILRKPLLPSRRDEIEKMREFIEQRTTK